MSQHSADQLIDRMLADAEFAETVIEAQNDPGLQQRLIQEYNLSEQAMSDALLRKFPLPDEVMDEIHGGLLSDLTWKDLAKKALYGGLTGGAAGGMAGGPKGAAIGVVAGAAAGAGGKILEEAIDSIVNWRW